MKKTLSILHTIYIAVISAMLITSAFRGSFTHLFSSKGCYILHTIIGVLLASLCIVIIVSHFRWPTLVNRLQVFWWIPQVVLVVSTRFTPEKTYQIINSFWHWPLGLVIAPQIGFGNNPSNILLVKLNVVAILGIIIATATRKKKDSTNT